MSNVIDIENRRELFWDEYLIDTEKTDAKLKLHKPQKKEVVLLHDQPWEGDGCNYHNIVKEDDFYRMYYLGWQTNNLKSADLGSGSIVVCYAESKDGLKWVKPKLGICEFNGSKENNIILDDNTAKFDNFSVFKDTNPYCPKNQIYKGVGIDNNDGYLWCFTSEDGIHFKKSHRMTNQGKFDTLNIAFWDKHSEQYVCYIRDFHDVPGNNLNAGIRDIRRMVSNDFSNWSEPKLLDFKNSDDYPLYTNAVQQYYRADHMFIGFPSRYVEKKAWTENFDQLAGADMRKKRMEINPRYGLAVTDCVFMTSRDGKKWNRWDEAFMTPGLESKYNWVYGDCYPAVGLIETKSDIPFAPNNLSMYTFFNHRSGKPTELRRYTLRIDGFVSYSATYKPCKIVTKPFIFKGDKLSVNFATSAIGFIKIKLKGQNKEINSIEHFGDSLNRTVVFKDGDAGMLSQKPVTMEIVIRDADIYSFKFE